MSASDLAIRWCESRVTRPRVLRWADVIRYGLPCATTELPSPRLRPSKHSGAFSFGGLTPAMGAEITLSVAGEVGYSGNHHSRNVGRKPRAWEGRCVMPHTSGLCSSDIHQLGPTVMPTDNSGMYLGSEARGTILPSPPSNLGMY